jgi:hypothetical protein
MRRTNIYKLEEGLHKIALPSDGIVTGACDWEGGVGLILETDAASEESTERPFLVVRSGETYDEALMLNYVGYGVVVEGENKIVLMLYEVL